MSCSRLLALDAEISLLQSSFLKQCFISDMASQKSRAQAFNELIAFQANSLWATLQDTQNNFSPPPPRRTCLYLRVLHGDLQDERQAAVVEGLVQSHQRSVHAALQQVAAVLPQTDGHHPVGHLLVGPHQHVCGSERRTPL